MQLGNQLTLRGSYGQLSEAVGMVEKMKLGEVSSFIRDWRARWDESGHWREVLLVE
jgi:hypothetical protein